MSTTYIVYLESVKYLYSNLGQILRRVKEAQKVLLLLDYDGTLTPIVRRPGLARLSGASRRLLKKLSSRVILGIVSGRSLRDIKDLVRIPGIIYAGNHGLEIEFKGKVWMHPGVRGFPERLDRISNILYQRLGHIPGIIVEHKGLTLSLHYRCVNKLHRAEVKRIFNSVVKSAKGGKRVYEIRPPVKWDKGRAVEKIIGQIRGKVLPVYIGDDVTDEDAFKAIKNKGITIYVGRPKKSYAEYFVWNVKEALKFLGKI